MKLFLASFLEPQNFGPGRLISIAEGLKPKGLKIDLQFKAFIPSAAIIERYKKDKFDDQEKAAAEFVAVYDSELETLFQELLTDSQTENCIIPELLPFQDGDTLASYERFRFNNYRKSLKIFLEKMGYEVVEKNEKA